MPSKDDLSEQLNLTTKLAAQVERMAAAADKLEGSYTQQTQTLTQLAQALNQLNIQGTVQSVQSLNDALKKMKTGMDETGKASESNFKKLGKQVEAAGKQFKDKFPKSVAVATAALSGFYQGIKNTLSIGKGITGFVGGFVDGLASITASIIAIPIKIFSGLIDMAAKSAGGSNELMQALEDLRKEFGAFYGPTNKAIIDTSKSLKGFEATGLSSWRVFGNMAERLKYIGELAKDMGGSFALLRQEMEDNGGAILAYQKGLGLSGEEMKGVTNLAASMGKKSSTVLKDMTKYSYALGESFGVDAKLISRDMGKAMADVAHFGGATVKQIAEASTYARKLGLELKDITGTLDAFDTFDTAAENAAKLSQAFGVQVDAFELMKEQDPAKQIDMLRKSFAKAGVDAGQMNRAQLKLLESTTGLDPATAKLAFSMKNQGANMAQIQKQGAKAEKSTMTQEQAMSKLADAIERMVQSGGSMEGGFWSMFVKGIKNGIMSSQEFFGLMQKIRIGLRQVYMEGVKLGRELVKMVPGLADIGKALNQLFEPSHITNLFKGFRLAIEKFFGKGDSDPNHPVKGSIPDLVLNLKDVFKHFFDVQGPGAHKLLDGFKTFFKFLSKTAAAGIRYVADEIAKGAGEIVKMLTTPGGLSAYSAGLGGAAKGGLGFLQEVIAPLIDALAHAWKVMAPALWELVKTLGKKFVEFLDKNKEAIAAMAKPVLGVLAGLLFGPAFTRGILGALTAAIAKGASGALTAAGGKIFSSLFGKAKKAAEEGEKFAGKTPDTGGIDTVGKVNKASGEAVKAGKGWGVKDAFALGAKLVAIATAISIGGIEMALAILAMKKIMGDMKLKDVVAPIAVLVGMSLAAIPLMFAMKLAKQAGNIKDILVGGLLISAAVGIVGLVGAGLAYVLKQVGTPAELSAAGDIMLKMSLVFLAMVPLIFASMVIGALASGPQAIALAAAAIGIGVIGTAVGEMAVVAMAIVEELNKMKIDSSFQRKVDAFLGVMKAIQAFADTLVKLIGLMTPSFTEFISGTAEKFTDKVKAAQGLIKDMIGERGKGGGIIGIVEIVMDSIRQLNIGGPGMAEAAKVFSEVLTAVTETIKAMTPPDAFFEAGSSFIVQLSGGKPFTDLATDVGYYAKLMRQGAMEMLTGSPDGKGKDGILGIIMSLSTFTLTEDQIKSSQVIGSLLSAVAQVMKNLTPNPETLKAFTTSVEESAVWGLAKTKIDKLNTQGIADVMTTMGTQFKQLIPILTSDIIKGVVEQVKSLSKGDLDGVKVMVDLLKVVVELTSAMGAIAKGPGANVTDVKEGGVVNIINMVPSLSSMLTDLSGNIDPLMKAMVAIVKGVPDDKSFMKNLETTKTLFGFLTEIPKLATTLQGINTGGDLGNTDPLVKSVTAMASFLMQLVTPGNAVEVGAGSPLQSLIDNVNKIGQIVSASAGSKIMSSVEMLGKVFEGVTKSAGNFSTMSATVTRATSDIKAGAMAPALLAVSTMVQTANDLDKALGDLNKDVNVKARLDTIAKAVGLGGKANYTVNPNRNVTLNINLEVTMDVDKVEKVMILRQSSIIRDRLDFALGKPDQAVTDLLSGHSVSNPPNIGVQGSATGK